MELSRPWDFSYFICTYSQIIWDLECRREREVPDFNLHIKSNHRSEQEYQKHMEVPGIEPGASYMRSKRSTTELHPLRNACFLCRYKRCLGH